MFQKSSSSVPASVSSLSGSNRVIKRAFDLCMALIVVIALFPLFFIVALMLKLESHGPVFLRQLQYAYDSKPIWLFKFRTTRFKEKGSDFVKDTRSGVTLVGSILRRTGIDELPQLFNVIWGEMSIVGPKPHLAAEDHLFEGSTYSCLQEHAIKPGIIDYADVDELRAEAGSSDNMRRRMEYDLHYVNNWSLWFDIKIILASITSKEALLDAW